jgi:VanZ like family
MNSSSASTAARILVVAGGALAIAGATLWPFGFSFRAVNWNAFVESFGLAPRTLLDLPRNIALFMPLGVGVGSLLEERPHANRAALPLILLLSLLMTACIEVLQVFLPGRTPNVSDMLGNTIGAVVGLVCLRAWRRRNALLRQRGPGVTLPNPVAFGLAYLFLVLAVAWVLMRGMLPGGWDPTSRVVVGPFLKDGEPWQGVVHSLVLLDRAVNEASSSRLLAGDVPAELEDAVLAEYGQTQVSAIPSRTSIPATERQHDSIAARVNASGQFTLGLILVTDSLGQRNSAGIAAVLGDSLQRDLMVGQDETRLTVRWRSALTGPNGLAPGISFPNVFESLGPQRVVLTFDGVTASIYTETGVGRDSVFLGPETVFSAIVRETNTWPIASDRLAWWVRAAPLAALIGLPLGFLTSCAVTAYEKRASRLKVLLGGLLAPAFLIELLVCVYRQSAPRLGVVALLVTMATFGAVVGHAAMHRPDRSRSEYR